MLKELDCVALTCDLPAAGIESGDVGTIVHVYPDGKAFEVEFFDIAGETIDVVPVDESQVRWVPDRLVSQARLAAEADRFVREAGGTFRPAEWLSWVRRRGARETDLKLIRSIKAMNFYDPASGLMIKRFWTFSDKSTGESRYHDLARLSPERRRKLIDQYLQFSEQLRSVRRAMTAYFDRVSQMETLTVESKTLADPRLSALRREIVAKRRDMERRRKASRDEIQELLTAQAS